MARGGFGKSGSRSTSACRKLRELSRRSISKSLATLAENIETPVGVSLQCSYDERRATNNRQTFPLRTNHAKHTASRLALADHFLVSILKDMQREKGSRKEHSIEGEQWEFHG